MKNTFIISAIAATLAIPAMADITGSSSCTEGVLGTSTNGSTANIDANWSANTINIKWYNGNTQLTQTSCQYDTTIVLPTQPTKPGYTFSGWHLRTTPPAPNCSAISDWRICGNTDGCVYNNGCRISIPVNTVTYSNCEEITNAETCLSISAKEDYYGSSINLCGWSNNKCYSEWTEALYEVPSASWCVGEKRIPQGEYYECNFYGTECQCMYVMD